MVGDEFSGLVLQCDKVRSGPNKFTLESIAIAAITALKEEAREDYTAAVREYIFTDTLPPQRPIRIVLRAAPGAAVGMLKRSSVMWSIRALAIELIRTRFFHPLLFTVKYYDRDLYGGILFEPIGAANPADAAVALPHSSFNKISNVLRRDETSLQDETHYQVGFRFVGEKLPPLKTFEALLTTLLQLARSDAASVQDRIAMENRRYLVWVFMRQVRPPAPGYTLQQYHAVAVLEAVARYYVTHGQYRELELEMLKDGHLTAIGCITRALEARRWCTFP
ncbi:MAG: hypothetical protein L6R36_005589 [Xanthoria steineri]|nr:MAG: hypothetical protein L6R36_005589 [Xanthoria steineri]